jgi:enoyl-CoA hydratase/3-hydroxyacyl-CoA dehydrogenase
MSIEDIKKIAVIGAGDMGHGIATVALLAGFEVSMRDIEQRFVDRGVEGIKKSLSKFVEKGKITEDVKNDALARLEGFVDFDAAVSDADFVIEAVPEIIQLKKDTFSELSKYTHPHTILASNTSNISITVLADATEKPDKVVGMHFFNPAVLMKLVEVIKGNETSYETADIAYKIAQKMNKVPILVKIDSPGFVYNRVNAPVTMLLSKILDAGSPSPEEFDAAFKAIMPMTPFELADYVGLDVAYHSLDYFAQVLSFEYAPSEKWKKMLDAGTLGKKTGGGFFDWSAGRPQIDPSKATKEFDINHLIALQVNEATKLLEEGVVDDPKEIDLAMANGGGSPFGPFQLATGIGYETLIEKCNELADRFDVEAFRPTKTMQEGTIKV